MGFNTGSGNFSVATITHQNTSFHKLHSERALLLLPRFRCSLLNLLPPTLKFWPTTTERIVYNNRNFHNGKFYPLKIPGRKNGKLLILIFRKSLYKRSRSRLEECCDTKALQNVKITEQEVYPVTLRSIDLGSAECRKRARKLRGNYYQ